MDSWRSKSRSDMKAYGSPKTSRSCSELQMRCRTPMPLWLVKKQLIERCVRTPFLSPTHDMLIQATGNGWISTSAC